MLVMMSLSVCFSYDLYDGFQVLHMTVLAVTENNCESWQCSQFARC